MWRALLRPFPSIIQCNLKRVKPIRSECSTARKRQECALVLICVREWMYQWKAINTTKKSRPRAIVKCPRPQKSKAKGESDVEKENRFLNRLVVITVMLFVAIISIVLRVIAPDIFGKKRYYVAYTSDSLYRARRQEQNRKEDEELRRTQAARYARHLYYVGARYIRKDTIARRFIVMNTSSVDIESGHAIVFSRRWRARSSIKVSGNVQFDTIKVTLRPLRSGLRDTLFLPAPLPSNMCRTIDSIGFMDVVFR